MGYPQKVLKGNSNFELGTAICYVIVENYFLTIIKHIAVPSSKLEFPFHYLFFAHQINSKFIRLSMSLQYILLLDMMMSKRFLIVQYARA